jgi:peroxiredoxin
VPVSVGDRLPSPPPSSKLAAPDGPKPLDAGYFAGRRVVLFALPGAFTPTCTKAHMPGFVARFDELKERGVGAVACLAVNDHHVMRAWAKTQNAEGLIDMLADGSGHWTDAIGYPKDLVAAGLGTRSQRYAMVVDDGVVSYLGFETADGLAGSSVEAVLAFIG